MGIGSTVKNMLSTQESTDSTGLDHGTSHTGNATSNYENNQRSFGFDHGTSRTNNVVSTNYDNSTLNDPTRVTSSNRASHKLPSGTGPGTSGKPVSETTMEQDLERSKGQGIAGYGTDAASAAGGSLLGTHQGTRDSNRMSGGFGPSSGNNTTSGKRGSVSGRFGNDPPLKTMPLGTHSTTTTTEADRDRSYDVKKVLEDNHHFGHSKHSAKDSMPTGETQEDTNQLNPVTHERIRHLETEEVERIKEHERHIHHIQHHTQPVVVSEELVEQHREFVHPVTHISETHANKVEDNTLFEGQIRQHEDTLHHGAKERTIVDKGTTVNEHTHHHVHHVIQPVIEKETIDRQHIHTTIPIHEVTHEAPVVHQSQTHAPVPMEHFLQRGGTMHGAVARDDIGRKVLHGGQCTREVDGVAEKMEHDLNLDRGTSHVHKDTSPGFTTTKVTQHTTTTTDLDPTVSTHPTSRN